MSHACSHSTNKQVGWLCCIALLPCTPDILYLFKTPQQLDKFYAGFVKKSKPKSIVIVPGAKALAPSSQQQTAAEPAQEQQLAPSPEA
jgi:hypothetical protein